MTTNTSYIKNQPVSFGLDINTNPPCRCKADPGMNYLQLVQYEDTTRFQMPNIAGRAVGTILNTNSGFGSGLSGWEIGDSDEELVADWSSSAGTASAGAGSKILFAPIELDERQRYRFAIKINVLQTDCQVVLVGYYSLTNPVSGDEPSTDYEVIAEYTSIGTKFADFIGAPLVGVGVMITGTGTGDSTIDSFSIQLWESANLPEAYITDSEGDTVVSGIEPVAVYDANLIYAINWATLDLEEGCYRICLPGFGDNLITAGDGGTFEDNFTGFDSDFDLSLTDAFQYQESKSVTVPYSNPGSPTVQIITILELESPIILKVDTEYVLEVKMMLNGGFMLIGDEVYWNLNIDTSGDVLIDQSDLIQGVEMVYDEWISFKAIFKTASSLPERTIRPVILFATTNTDPASGAFFFDQYTLLEQNLQASQAFSLKNEHKCSLKLISSNDDDAFGFLNTEDYPFEIRVEGNLGRPTYPDIEYEPYQDSAGSSRVAYAASSKVYQFTANNQPEYIHDHLRLALISDTFTIDGTRYIKRGEYSPVWRDKTFAADGQVEVVEAEGLFKNSNC